MTVDAPSPSVAAPVSTAPKRRMRIRPSHAVIGGLLGAAGAFIGSGVFMLAAMFVVFGSDPPDAESLRSPEFLESIMKNFPIVASSVVGTAVFLTGVPLLTAKLSKTSIREGLGFRPAPIITFVLAPVGILALGPTSEQLVRFMKWAAPSASLNALESIGALVSAHPAWMLWPIIALCPGIAEEVFFRGLVQRAAGFGLRAIVLSGITFSFFHLDPHHVAGVLPLGFYLAWLGARTGSTWVPIVAHIANNSVALLASKLVGTESMADETMPMWVMPIGWVICAGCCYVIWWATKDRARWLGPAAEPGAAADPNAPKVSPDWRIVRATGAQEEVLGYVRAATLLSLDPVASARDARGAGPSWGGLSGVQLVGQFQPGHVWDDYAAHVADLDSPVGSAAHQEATAALMGFGLEDLRTREPLPNAAFRVHGDQAFVMVLPVRAASTASTASQQEAPSPEAQSPEPGSQEPGA